MVGTFHHLLLSFILLQLGFNEQRSLVHLSSHIGAVPATSADSLILFFRKSLGLVIIPPFRPMHQLTRPRVGITAHHGEGAILIRTHT